MCGIIGVIDRRRQCMDGTKIKEALASMNERGSGEGAGYVAYGIYPDYKDYYALHVFFDNIRENKIPLDNLLEKWGTIVHDEQIKTYEQPNIRKVHTPWRYFFRPDRSLMPKSTTPDEDIVTHLVMKVNSERNGTLIFSSGKNLGVFKAAGWPEDVANFYRIEDYKGYLWLAHNRYPTNTAGWWGGAHPFNLLNWSVVHNGEITSYGTNRRYIESYGYKCTMYTDTEVVAYLVDLLVRKHGLSEQMAVRALAPPFWQEIDRMPAKEQELNRAIRLTYGPALMNGPFAICVANENALVGFTDRIKLRPLVTGENGDRLFISSEESAIRRIDPDVGNIAMPKAGEPVIGEGVLMSIGSTPLRFKVRIDPDRCMNCGRCIENCSYGVFRMEDDKIRINSRNCVACHRCLAFCPRDAIDIEEKPGDYRSHPVWTREIREAVFNQAKTGKIISGGMGNALPWPIIFDRLVLDACQVTNPSIDPLREPMELRTYVGKKPSSLSVRERPGKDVELLTKLSPNLQIETPIMIGHMSYGAISLPAQQAMAKAVHRIGTFMGTGEGGLHQSLYPYQKNMIVQVASGRFGVDIDYLERGAAIEIKIGQGAKPGIGGHLPGEKVCADVACTRMIPEGSDAISPAPHHDIYSIEDLKQLVHGLKEATEWKKPVFVKIAAVHNSAAIAAGIARSGADAVVIDGFRGGTGSAPVVFRDHVGIPIEAAIASVDAKLRQQGIRNEVSIIASGGIRQSADVAKIICLGADAVYIGTSALVAMGCRVCGTCNRGTCAWGIATQKPELTKRLDPETNAVQVENLIHGWTLELAELMGAAGINSIESLRGNRDRFRGYMLDEGLLEVLDVKTVGA